MNMHYWPCLAVLLFFSAPLFSQGYAPEIRNLKAAADTAAGEVHITYDLIDPDSREVQVHLRASNDHGQSWLLYTKEAKGDLGLLVLPGSNKRITWRYNKKIGNVFDFKIKLIADDGDGLDYRQLISQTDSTRLQSDVKAIEGIRHYLKGAPGLEIAKATLYERFFDYGLEAYRQEFMLGGYRGHNISGKLKGQINELNTLLVVAHFDTQADSPGANDNASGLAVMLEAARILSELHLKKSIVFVGLDLQKQGAIGAKRYIQNLKAHEISSIDAGYNLDNVGVYSDTPLSQELSKKQEKMFSRLTSTLDRKSWRGDFLFAISDAQSIPSRNTFTEMASAYVPGLTVEGLKTAGKGSEKILFGNGVYAHFWERGIPMVLLTDGAESRNKFYESGDDTAEGLNFSRMNAVVKALVVSLAHKANPIHGDVETCDVHRQEKKLITDQVNSHIADYHLYLTDNNNTLKVRINNPTSGKLNLRLLNTKGEVFYQSNIDLYYESVITINISYLESDVYLVNLSNEHFDELKEFILP